MGSGAFLVEAIDQLADAYLQRKQEERKEPLDPDRYALEKQKVATYIATNNCYGVDLNPMAARFAGVSLWLATMHQGQEAPWFGARLAVGNSLVGARLAVWSAADLATDEPLKKELAKLLKKHSAKPDLEDHVEKLLAIAKDAPDAVASIRSVFAEAKKQWAIEDEERESEEDEEAAAERASARRAQLAKDLKKAIADFALPRHHRKPPSQLSAKDVIEGKRPPRSIYHFLLPDAGMSPFDKDKAVQELVPSEVAKLKTWRKTLTAKYDKPTIERLVRLSDQVDRLYARYVEDRRAALKRCRARAPTWGQDDAGEKSLPIADRMKALEALRADGMPYARLGAVMDLWAAQWAWPLRDADTLPSRERWWSEAERLLGVEPTELRSFEKQLELMPSIPPPRDEDEEEIEIVAERDLAGVVADVVGRLRPHHWELEFAEVFVDGGGFDLIVGNPPWIRLDWNEQGILGDLDPRLVLDGVTAGEAAAARARIVTSERAGTYLTAAEDVLGVQASLSSVTNYPSLAGLRTNLYKNFLARSWSIAAATGVVGLIHQESLLDDHKGGAIRRDFYLRARHLYRFQNQLKLFAEVGNMRPYAMSVSLGSRLARPAFATIANLYHPRTIDQTWSHDGAGAVPDMKTEGGQFEMRGHQSRAVLVDEAALRTFASVFDPPGTPALEARLPALHSRELLSAVQAFAHVPATLSRLGDGVAATQCWNETTDVRHGLLRKNTCWPATADELVLSGPHVYVGNPLAKTPREGCSSHRDYEPLDLESVGDDYLPRTNFLPGSDRTRYAARAPRFQGRSTFELYRHVHRNMIATTSERSVIGAIMPPQVAHVGTLLSLSFADPRHMTAWHAFACSLPLDFVVRITGKAHFQRQMALLTPLPAQDGAQAPALSARALRLNCLTRHYADLWNQLWPTHADAPAWTLDDPRLSPWPPAETRWHRHCALRNAFERRWALVEIDALAALELGLTIDELCTIYRTQFPVLREYEQNTWYDQNGRIVFTTNRGLPGVGLDRKTFEAWQEALATGAAPPEGADPTRYTPPFETRNREADLRHAYIACAPRTATHVAGKREPRLI